MLKSIMIVGLGGFIGTVLRFFVSSTDKYKDALLYEHLVFKAKEFGLTGASVFKGVLGFGASSRVLSQKFWEISEKLPVVVEIIDTEDRILSFYESIKPDLETMRYGCLVLLEEASVLLSKPGRKH